MTWLSSYHWLRGLFESIGGLFIEDEPDSAPKDSMPPSSKIFKGEKYILRGDRWFYIFYEDGELTLELFHGFVEHVTWDEDASTDTTPMVSISPDERCISVGYNTSPFTTTYDLVKGNAIQNQFATVSKPLDIRMCDKETETETRYYADDHLVGIQKTLHEWGCSRDVESRTRELQMKLCDARTENNMCLMAQCCVNTNTNQRELYHLQTQNDRLMVDKSQHDMLAAVICAQHIFNTAALSTTWMNPKSKGDVTCGYPYY